MPGFDLSARSSAVQRRMTSQTPNREHHQTDPDSVQLGSSASYGVTSSDRPGQRAGKQCEEAHEETAVCDVTATDQTTHTAVDRVANVSVHFPCSPFAAELARQIQAAQRNKRRILTATNPLISLAPHPSSSPDPGGHAMSFDALPDSVISRVFASGLDSCELCRCGPVCRRWNLLVWNDSRLWTTIDLGGREALDVDQAVWTLTRAVSRSTPQLCVGVKTVILRGCRRLTDEGLRTVARRCTDLRRLDVSCCTLITDFAVFDLLSRCVNLRHLDITGL